RRVGRPDLLAGRRLPDDDFADLVAGRDVLAVGGEGAGVEHRREVVGRDLGVAAQLVPLLTRGGVPDAADHVVGDAHNRLAVRRGDDGTNPFGVGVLDGADRRPFRAVPPDEFAVPAAGDEGVAGQGNAGDVAAVPR